MNTTPISDQLIRSLHRLVKCEVWLDMLAENAAYPGGGERFFHRSLLWAFNTVDNPLFYATIEKRVPPLRGNEALDLGIYENRAELNDAVWAGTISDLDWLAMGKAFAELKTYYNRGKIRRDVDRLRRVGEEAAQSALGHKELYEILLVGHYFFDRPDDECVSEIDKGEQDCWTILEEAGINQRDHDMGHVWILKGRKNPSDRRADIYLKAVVVRVDTGG